MSNSLLESLLTSVRPAVWDRRSVLLLLEEEWNLCREDFWGLLFRAMAPGVPVLSRTPFAESLARVASHDDDLAPLTAGSSEPATSAAFSAYRFVCRFAIAVPKLVSTRPWLQLCKDVSAGSRSEEALAIAASLTYKIVARCGLDTPERVIAADAARSLMRTAWGLGLQPMAFGAVVDTMDVEPGKAFELFRMLLESPAEHSHRREALRLLAHDVDKLSQDPSIASALYFSAVAEEADAEQKSQRAIANWYREVERAKENGGDAPPGPPRSSRTDVGVEYWLKQYIGTFLTREPSVAARAYVEAIAYWERATDLSGSPVPIVSLAIRVGRFLIEARPSTGMHAYSTSLADQLLRALVATVASSTGTRRAELFEVLVGVPASSSVWAALIQCIPTSESLLEELAPLVTDVAALRLFAKAIAAAIKALGHRLPSALRSALHDAVGELSLETDHYDRYVLEQALSVHSSDETDGTDSGDGRVAVIGPGDANDALDMARFNVTRAELGGASNAIVRAATRRGRDEFLRLQPLREGKNDDELVVTVQVIDSLRSALQATSISPAIETAGWSMLAQLASLRITMTGKPNGEDDVYECAKRTDGQAHPKSDLLNAAQSIPRAESVVGLIALASQHQREKALAEIDRLSRDVEPGVRFQIAFRLRELCTLRREQVWPWLVRLIEDPNSEIAAAATNELNAFYKMDATAALSLATGALARFSDSDGDAEGRTDALLQLAWHHLARANPAATKAVMAAVDDLAKYPVGFGRLLHSFRDWLVMTGEEETEEPVRLRTVALFANIARLSIAALPTDRAALAVRSGEQRDPLVQLVDEVATQLYFASGASSSVGESQVPLSEPAALRFYLEMRDLLLELGTSGVLSAGSHVLETLEHFLVHRSTLVDSRDVLERFQAVAESVVSGGIADSYWFLDPIEKVLRRCVADRSLLLRDDAVLSSWSRILAPLLELGWPQAFALASELDLSL